MNVRQAARLMREVGAEELEFEHIFDPTDCKMRFHVKRMVLGPLPLPAPKPRTEEDAEKIAEKIRAERHRKLFGASSLRPPLRPKVNGSNG